MAAHQISQSDPAKELHDSAWSVRRRWAWSAPAIAALVFVLMLVVTHGGGIAGTPYWPAQQTVFLKMNAWLSTYPAWMWSGLTLMGDSVVLFSMLALFVLRKPQVFVAVLASVPVGGLFSAVVKHWAGVLRPPAVLDPTLFTLIGPALQFQSFPSGHSITAFAAAAAVLATLTPSVRPNRDWWWLTFFLLAATGISLSRIAVGVHWPIDVVAGASGGWLAGLSGAALARRGRWWPWMFVGTGRWVAVAGLAIWGMTLLIRPHDGSLADLIVLGLSASSSICAAIGLAVGRLPSVEGTSSGGGSRID